MRNLDILAAENGEHVRVLLCGEEQSYVVSCQHFRMPYPVASDLLAELQPVPAETYSVFVLDEDITNRQREGRNRKLDLIAPLLEDACIYDKSHRNEVVRRIAAEHGIARRTLLQYLWRYWVYQSKNALLPAERPAPEQHELTADEKAIRWALNKYYYTPQRQSLQTAYKMMLRAKYCDTHGTLKPEYPTFWQFRYFFRKNRDPISETISRQGLKAYQRNHRPFTGSVCDYAHTIGVYMTDATVADIYIVSRLSRKPIGRPVIYTMVDAYSRLITGVYVGLEGGQYALRLLLQNTFTDKVSFCHQHGIDIDPQDWPSHHLPTKIMTDRGSEFVAGTLENLCESYHIEIENLPAYRPDLKGVVEKLFDLVQSAYKPLLKGKGVIESDTQERGAPDYRRQGTLDLEQFTAVVLRCVLFYNSKSVQTGFTRTPAMIETNTPPLAASIWSFCEAQDDCPVKEATDKKLLYTLLPRAEGKITQRGLEIFGLRFSNCTFKKRFVSAGLGGRETVQVAYAPECMDTVWLYENGTYLAFDLVQKAYLGKSLAEIADAQQLEKVERTDWKKQELQAQLDLMSDIQAIADGSERTMPDRSNISRQIQRNRSTARKQESVSLMDLLAEQQEDGLKKVAADHAIALLVIHHLRKANDENNPFNRIYGSVATQAALDTMMVLEKDTHFSDTAQLHISGRRCAQQEFVLSFDTDSCSWSMVGNADEVDEKFHHAQYERSETVIAIKEAISRGNGTWRGSMSQLSRVAESIPYIGHGLGNPRNITNEVKFFADDLYRYDGITFTSAKNGTGGRKYTFKQTLLEAPEASTNADIPFDLPEDDLPF